MCHERWASRRDELVETSWLRDLRSRRDKGETPGPVSPADPPTSDTPLTEPHDEPVVVGER